MLKVVQPEKLPNWRLTPVGSKVLLCVAASRSFVSSLDGALVTGQRRNRAGAGANFTIERLCTVVTADASGGQKEAALQIPAVDLYSTTDSTQPDVHYTAWFADPTTKQMLGRWEMFRRFQVPPDLGTEERVTWQQIHDFMINEAQLRAEVAAE